MIIGVSGYARSGKDTVGMILAEQHGFERRAFADKLKQLALLIDPGVGSAFITSGGWEKAKEISYVREYLQTLGASARNVIGEDVWVRALFNDIDENKNYVITDVRFINEAQAIQHAGGLIVRVNRPGVGAVNGHISEHQMDGYDFDAVIPNDGSIEDLASKLSSLLCACQQES
jgi:hypothetical protein